MALALYKRVVGIDPDSDRSGFALLDTETRRLEVATLRFPALVERLRLMSGDESLMVYLEAGWLNHGNWHTSRADSVFVAAKKGLGVGRNQQTGMLIAEMCEAMDVPCTPIRPLPKLWQGKDKKITQAEIEAFAGPIGRTNQEGRDAALIAWTCAGLPIKLTKKK